MDEDEQKEIIYNIVNSLLAGGLVFLGGLSTGNMTWETVAAAAIAAGVVALTKFRDYWLTKGDIFRNKKGKAELFSFL